MVAQLRGLAYHLESLISKLPGLISRCGIYSTAYVILLRYTLHFRDSFPQLIMHGAIQDGVPDVVTQVKGTNKKNVDSGYLGYLVDL
jgi:hypothetical protein